MQLLPVSISSQLGSSVIQLPEKRKLSTESNIKPRKKKITDNKSKASTTKAHTRSGDIPVIASTSGLPPTDAMDL
jgi:hypothetical protein